MDIMKAINEFNNENLPDIIKEENELEIIRRAFVSDFSIDNIEHMSIDDYVIGTGNRNGFSYRIEKELGKLGALPPHAGSTRYGIWADREAFLNGKLIYHVQPAFGPEDYPDVAFERIRRAILELLEAGKIDNRNVINNSPLQSNYKYKLLFTYYPKKFHNICAKDHAALALYTLGYSLPENYDLLEMTDVLSKWRDNNLETKEWSNYSLMRFLYDKLKIKENNSDEFNTAKNPKIRAQAAAHKSVIEAQKRIVEKRELEKIEKEKSIIENTAKLVPGKVFTHKVWGKVEIVEVKADKVKVRKIIDDEVKTLHIVNVFDFIE